jgi:hypothetical protein
MKPPCIVAIVVLFSFPIVLLSQPTPAHLFSPSSSSSFNKDLFTSHPKFANSYADDSTITGYVGKDIIQWGGYSASVEFGCASVSDTSGVWDCDGILGLGLKDNSMQASILATPYFYSLCDSNSGLPCVFSLLLTSTGGEIQLGGYKPASVLPGANVTYSQVTTPCCDDQVSYQVSVTSIRIAAGAASRTIYTTPITGSASMVTIVDSGISCIALPANVVSSSASGNVYADAMNFLRANPGATLYFKIGGVEFAVPLVDNCLLSSGSEELALGDPFFREVLVVHDLSNKASPRLGFARKNPAYNPATLTPSSLYGESHTISQLRASFATHFLGVQDNEESVTTLPLVKMPRTGDKRNIKRNALVDTVPTTTPDKNIYYTALSVGTPRQSPFIVQVDTGSSLTAIFVEQGSVTPGWQIALFTIFIILLFAGIVTGGIIFYRRKKAANKPGDYRLVEE